MDTHLLMIDDPVKRLDNMSMAWGIEARVPFLDQDLVELAAACPPGLKTSQGGKGILKNLGRRLLPKEVVDRPKGYFPVPAL
ncbi:asparagine synthase-related protein, partial [Burkholderia sp. SIMBA_045]